MTEETKMKSKFALFPLFTLMLALSFGWSFEVQAQGTGTGTPTAAPAPEKKPIPAGFEPIAGKEEAAESVSAPLLVVVAYGTFFLLTFGYVVHVVRRQKALSDEIAAVRKKVGGGGS
jgi:hypothetical protein